MTTVLVWVGIAAAQGFPGTIIPPVQVDWEIWRVPSDGSAATKLSSVFGVSVPQALNYPGLTSQEWLEFFDIELCGALGTSAHVLDAVGMYQDLGIPFQVFPTTAPYCPFYAVDDSSWFKFLGPQGQALLDDHNQIKRVNAGDDRQGRVAPFAGSTFVYGREYRDENNYLLDIELTWEIALNVEDWDFISDCPSAAEDWSPSTGMYVTDSIAHELLHVLGGQHLVGPQGTLPNPELQTVMQRVQNGGHFAMEAFGDPYDPSGTYCGTYALPLYDQLFLELLYPALFEPESATPRLFNWEYEFTGSFWRAVPVAWGSIGSLGTEYLGTYCPGDMLTPGAQQSITDHHLQFTQAGTVGQSYFGYAGRSEAGDGHATGQTLHLVAPGAAPGSAGYAYYDIEGDGTWDGAFTPPGWQLQTVDPTNPAYNSYLDRLYHLRVSTSDGSEHSYLPLAFATYPACAPGQVDECCGVH